MGRLGIVYVLFKVHKDSVDNCLLFQSILSAINTPTYKLAKISITYLKSVTSNKYALKDSQAFAEEIAEQDSEFFIGSRNIDSLFTNISLEEATDICTNNTLFENTEGREGSPKIEFKETLSLATKESYF